MSLIDDSIPELPNEILKLDSTVYCLAWGNSYEKPALAGIKTDVV